MLTGIDHVIILADDLDTVITQYERLGFTVTPGGRHPRFTHNALIPFKDGTYLELIAFYEQPDPDRDEMHRWHRHLTTGGGLVDFAIGATSVEAVQLASKARGVAMDGPVQGGRKRLDGIDIRWRSVVPEGDNAGAIPFVIEDQTDRALRVPLDAAEHANGVTGIHALIVAVSELPRASERYAGLLAQNEAGGEGVAERDGASGVLMMVGPHRVEVVAPTSDGAMQEMLDQRGDSVFELELLSPRAATIDPQDAANARIRFVATQE